MFSEYPKTEAEGFWQEGWLVEPRGCQVALATSSLSTSHMGLFPRKADQHFLPPLAPQG